MYILRESLRVFKYDIFRQEYTRDCVKCIIFNISLTFFCIGDSYSLIENAKNNFKNKNNAFCLNNFRLLTFKIVNYKHKFIYIFNLNLLLTWLGRINYSRYWFDYRNWNAFLGNWGRVITWSGFWRIRWIWAYGWLWR